MRRKTGIGQAAVVLCATGALTCQTFTAKAQVVYPDFSSAPGMMLNGGAKLSGDAPASGLPRSLRMNTLDERATSASAFLAEKQFVAGGFNADFDFRFTGGLLADGFTFIVHNDPRGTQALGSRAEGSDLGYSRLGVAGTDAITPSLVIEFDDYASTSLWDPPFNVGSANGTQMQLSVQPNGAARFASSLGSVILGRGPAGSENAIPNGATRTAMINYAVNPGPNDDVLTVTVSGPAGGTLTINSGLDAVLGGLIDPQGRAYVGFTGASGGATQNADISRFRFDSVPEPTSLASIATLAGILLLRRRNDDGVEPADCAQVRSPMLKPTGPEELGKGST